MVLKRVEAIRRCPRRFAYDRLAEIDAIAAAVETLRCDLEQPRWAGGSVSLEDAVAAHRVLTAALQTVVALLEEASEWPG